MSGLARIVSLALTIVLTVTPARALAHEGEDHGTPAATTGGLGPVSVTPEVRSLLGLETEEVGLRTVEETLTCYGTIEPRPENIYWASARFPGRVRNVFFTSGQHVSAGERLVEVESREIAEHPVVVPLTSPIAGTVTARNVSIGQPVEPDTVLYEVADLSRVYVKCEVFEVDAARVRMGGPASVFVETILAAPILGEVVLIAGALDPDNRTRAAWIALENVEKQLRPGMRVRVEVVTSSVSDVVAILRAAVLGASGNFFVFVEGTDEYVGVPVGLGRIDRAYVEITEGLVPGDRVVVQGAYQLQFAAAAKSTSASSALDDASVARAKADNRPAAAAPERSSVEPAQTSVRLSALAERNLAITTVTADFRRLDHVQRCVGTIEPAPTSLHIASTRTPGRVARVYVVTGQTVEKGELLAEIESRQVAEPPAQVKIRASRGGVVTESHVFVGEPVEPDKRLFTIAGLDEMLVKCHVSEPHLPNISPLQKVRISSPAYPARIFDGRVEYLGGEADAQTRAVPVYMSFDAAPGTLVPNMLVTASIVVGSEEGDVIAIERAAVVSPDAGEPFVFVRSGESFHRRRVVLGRKDDRHVEVIDGVLPGDTVVVEGADGLQFATDSPPAADSEASLPAAEQVLDAAAAVDDRGLRP